MSSQPSHGLPGEWPAAPQQLSQPRLPPPTRIPFPQEQNVGQTTPAAVANPLNQRGNEGEGQDGVPRPFPELGRAGSWFSKFLDWVAPPSTGSATGLAVGGTANTGNFPQQ
jgi:hypothetical protein